jgi:HEPN domain-containing protein
MAEPSFATALLTLAEQDALAFRKLADDPAVGDALVGFHAQQAVEKALKAALSHRGVAYRRTHDIAELLDLIADSGISAPPHELRLDELNPYAVHMRYGLIDPTGLDRAEIGSFLSDVLQWARDLLRQN